MGRPRRHYADCRYGQLHFVRAAPDGPTGTPLVLLHQNPSSSLEYRYLIERMSLDRVVIALDTPGSGMSDAPPGPVSAANYALALADALEAIGTGGQVDLFGFHTGTMLAAELAIARPAMVRRLVLTGIPFRPPHERTERLDKIHKVAPPDDSGASTFERLHWLWEFTVQKRHPDVPVERAADIFIDRAKALHRYWWPYDAVWRWPVEERLPLVTQPVLVLQPDELLRVHSIEAAALFPDARVEELPSLNRDVFELEGGVDEFAAAMRRFLI